MFTLIIKASFLCRRNISLCQEEITGNINTKVMTLIPNFQNGSFITSQIYLPKENGEESAVNIVVLHCWLHPLPLCCCHHPHYPTPMLPPLPQCLHPHYPHPLSSSSPSSLASSSPLVPSTSFGLLSPRPFYLLSHHCFSLLCPIVILITT